MGIKDQGRRSGRHGRTIQALLKEKGHCRGQQLIKQVVGLMTPPSYSRRRKGTVNPWNNCLRWDLWWYWPPWRSMVASTWAWALGRHLPSPSPPNSPSMSQPPSSIVHATDTTPQRFDNVCGCSQDLVQKLDVLKDIRQSLKEDNEMDNNFQKQLIELKKAKLALKERRLVILPDESGNIV